MPQTSAEGRGVGGSKTRSGHWTERAAAAYESRTFYNDPVGWMERFVEWPAGGGLTGYQQEILWALPARRRVAVRSPHGAGKTALAALTLLWFACTREVAGVDWKVVSTASAWRHLTIYLWPEVHKWAARVRWAELGSQAPSTRTQLLDLRLKLRHGAASAVASDEPVNIEGAHAESLLYVFDESKAIPPETWDAAEGAFSGGRTDGSLPEAFALAISTPGAPSGRFYEIHSQKPGLQDWWTRHITIAEAVAAGRVNEEWVELRKLQFGESSAVFINRVLGEFCAADEECVIPLAWVEASQDRWRAWRDAKAVWEQSKQGEDEGAGDGDTALPLTDPHAPLVIGVDVARGGADHTCISRRRGHLVEAVQRFPYGDTMTTTARVAAVIANEGMAIVDSAGLGAGVVDRSKELNLKVVPFTGAAGTKYLDRSREFGFTNTRTAAWWFLRELLDPAFGSEVMLPDTDDQIVGDLTAPRMKEYTSGRPPKIRIESKEDVNKRLGRSTDIGDSIVMSFWLDRSRGLVELSSPLDLGRPADDEGDGDASEAERTTDGRKTVPRGVGEQRPPQRLSLSPLA